MSIIVGRVENLFWDNNSYKKPNAVPVFAESEVVNRRPIIYDFFGGRTHLNGDKWNYAIYDGVYYFLKIDKTYDVRKKHFSYVLIRDIWMNILTKNVVDVKGRLTCTGRDEWISANLNRTFSALEDPVNVTRITLGGEVFNLSKHVSIRPATKGLPLTVLSKTEIESFKQHFITALKTYKVQLAPTNNFFKSKKSPIFIFDILRGFESHTYSWKENIKNRINNFLEELKSLKERKGHEEDIVISRVGEGMSSILKDKYCITWKTGGIGTAKETIKLHEIDLSGLEDIVQVNISSLKELTKEEILAQPYMKRISEDLFKNFYDFKYIPPKTYKIRRKIYFPMTTATTNCGMAMKTHAADNKVDMAAVNWKFICPQRVSTRYGDIFLSYLNDINFTLSYWKILYVRGGTGYSPTIVYRKGDNWFEKNPPIAWTYPHHSFNDISDWHFYDRDSDLFTPMGFLIFGFFNYKTFDGFKCKAEEELGKIQYISGLKNSQLSKIADGSFFTEYKTKLYELPYKLGARFIYNKSPSQNWQRYWHNVVNSLDMILLPNGKGYEYSWRAYIKDDKLSGQYPIRALQTDQEAWNPLGAPFKDRARHEASILRSYELIDKVAMKTIVEMPLTIKAGDYLFTDMEYWMGSFNTEFFATSGYQLEDSFLGGVKKHYYKAQNLILEDFLHQPQNIVENTGGIAIISTLEGKIELRKLDTFALTHRLHGPTYSEAQVGNPIFLQTGFDSFSKEIKGSFTAPEDFVTDEQGVSNVDGTNSRRVGYLALRRMEGGDIAGEDPIDNKLMKRVMYEFLKSKGYVVSRPIETENDFIANVLFLENEDFEGNNPLLFDLKGTDWYAYIRRGKISLIAKTVEIFDKTTDQIMGVPKNEKLKQLSALEKVNQKCVLTVRTHDRPLKTKFKFDGDNIDLTVSNIVTSKNSVTDYFFLALRGDFDVIEKDIISVPKSQLDSVEIVNHLEIEALRVQMLRNDRNFEVARERDIEFGREKLTEEYRHKEKLLAIEGRKRTLDMLATGIEGTVGPFVRAFRSGNPVSAAFTLLGGTMRGMKALADKTFEWEAYSERVKHTEKEKEFSFRSLAYNSLQIDLTHRDFEEDSIRRINQVAHVYRKGTVNDTDLMREFRKETEGLEENKEIFLTVFTPSGEQLRLLEAHKEEYGVDCDIPSAILTFKEGMDEEVVKFKNLTDEGIVGLDNLIERDFLRSTLEIGVKVVNITSNPPDERNQYVCTNIYTLTQELAKRREEYLRDSVRVEVLEAANKKLSDEIEVCKGTLEDLKTKKQELEAEAAELNKNIGKLQDDLQKSKDEAAASKANVEELTAKKQELEGKAAALGQEITKLQEDLSSSRDELSKSKGELEKSQGDLKKALDEKAVQKEQLDAEIKRHRDDLREAEQKWDNCKRDYQNEKDAHNRLVKEKEELDARIKEKDSKIGELENTVTNLNDELGNSKGDLKKALDDLEAQKALLEGEKKRHRDDLREAEQKWDDCKRDYQNEKDAHNRVLAEKEKLEERISEMDEKLKDYEEGRVKLPSLGGEIRCNIFKKAIATSYTQTLGIQASGGFDPFTGVVMEIVQNLFYIRRSRMDQQLMKIPEMEVVMKVLAEMEGIPLIDKMLDLLGSEKWEKAMGAATAAGEAEGPQQLPPEAQAAMGEMLKIQNTYLNWAARYALKALIDDLLWSCYLAYDKLKETVEDNIDLQAFFAHIFPGKRFPRTYQYVFGPSFGLHLARVKFFGEECSPEEDPIEKFKDLMEKDWFEGIKGISGWGEQAFPWRVVNSKYSIDTTKITPYLFPKEFHYDKGWALEEIKQIGGRYVHLDKGNIFYARATMVFKCMDTAVIFKKDHWIGLRMKSGAFENVKEEREKIWNNRANFKFSDEIIEKFAAGGETVFGAPGGLKIEVGFKVMVPNPPTVRGKGNTIDIRPWQETVTIDLVKIFGHKYQQALILIALLFFRGLKWRRESAVGYKGRNFDCWYIEPTRSPETPIDDFVAAILGIKTERPAYWGPQYIRRTPLEIIQRWRAEEALGKQDWERRPPFSSYHLSNLEVMDKNNPDSPLVVTMGVEFANVESLINYIYHVVQTGELKDPAEWYSDASKIKALKDAMAKLA